MTSTEPTKESMQAGRRALGELHGAFVDDILTAFGRNDIFAALWTHPALYPQSSEDSKHSVVYIYVRVVIELMEQILSSNSPTSAETAMVKACESLTALITELRTALCAPANHESLKALEQYLRILRPLYAKTIQGSSQAQTAIGNQKTLWTNSKCEFSYDIVIKLSSALRVAHYCAILIDRLSYDSFLVCKGSGPAFVGFRSFMDMVIKKKEFEKSKEEFVNSHAPSYGPGIHQVFLPILSGWESQGNSSALRLAIPNNNGTNNGNNDTHASANSNNTNVGFINDGTGNTTGGILNSPTPQSSGTWQQALGHQQQQQQQQQAHQLPPLPPANLSRKERDIIAFFRQQQQQNSSRFNQHHQTNRRSRSGSAQRNQQNRNQQGRNQQQTDLFCSECSQAAASGKLTVNQRATVHSKVTSHNPDTCFRIREDTNGVKYALFNAVANNNKNVPVGAKIPPPTPGQDAVRLN